MSTLTIIDSPTFYNFSRNSITAKISTDNYATTTNTGKKALGIFIIVQALVNQTMTVTFNATTYVFTFKAATNIGLLQIAVKSVGQSYDDYCAQVAADLMTSAPIAAAFNVTADYTNLVFTAIAPGPQYSLTGSSTNALGGAFYNNILGTDNIIVTVKENYKIKLSLYEESAANSGVFNKIIEIEKEPSGNFIKCDLGPIIDNYLEYKMPPNWSVPSAFFCEQLCKRFYVKINEKYGYPQVTASPTIVPPGFMQNATDTINFSVLKAGFDVVSSRYFGGFQFNFYLFYKSFLTRQPRVKKIARYQTEYLYFLFHNTLTANAAINYTLYDKAGVAVQYVMNATAPIFYGNVWAFPVNEPNGFFVNYPEIVKMEVEVIDLTSFAILSEKFTYLADDEIYLDEKFIFFMNADGGMDTIRMSGSVEHNIDFSYEVAERTLIPFESPYEGDSKTLYSQKTNTTKVFSGFCDQAKLNYIEDLILTKKAFIVGNDYNSKAVIPIIITSKKLVRKKTNQNLKGFVIEYYEAIRSELTEYSYHPIA
jgi:hypothetical protein